jgi:hypothetical protein
LIKIKTETTSKGDELVKRLIKIIKHAPNAHVRIGFFEGAGSYQGKDAPDVIEVALWNEYGTSRSPARSFIGSAIDENEASIAQWREEIIEGIVLKGWTIEKGMEYMGFHIKTLIENKIKSNVPPPNAPSTIAMKAADGVSPNTLIHTGLMLRSVTYQVFLK